MEFNWWAFWFYIIHSSFGTIITWWGDIINFKFVFTSEAYLRFYILTKWLKMTVITLGRDILNSFFFDQWLADSCRWRPWPYYTIGTCWIIQTWRGVWIRYKFVRAAERRSECNISTERLYVTVILSWRWSDFYRHLKSNFRFYDYTLRCWFYKSQCFINIICARSWIFIWFFWPDWTDSHLFITIVSEWLWLIISSRS